MKRYIKQIIPIFMMVAMLVGLTGCGVVKSGTTEYNELVALVQGVQSAASNFQLVTDTQYAKIQAKTQITKDYYDAVSTSGEVWTGNFRSQADALTNLLNNYHDENGQPLDPTNLNLNDLQGKGTLPDGLGQGFTLYVNAITQAPPPGRIPQ
jgi:hypothetical protein